MQTACCGKSLFSKHPQVQVSQYDHDYVCQYLQRISGNVSIQLPEVVKLTHGVLFAWDFLLEQWNKLTQSLSVSDL